MSHASRFCPRRIDGLQAHLTPQGLQLRSASLQHDIQLGPVESLLWERLDGTQSVSALADLLSAELGQRVATRQLWTAIDALADQGLLVERPAPPAAERGVSRRNWLREGVNMLGVAGLGGFAASAHALSAESDTKASEQSNKIANEQQAKLSAEESSKVKSAEQDAKAVAQEQSNKVSVEESSKLKAAEEAAKSSSQEQSNKLLAEQQAKLSQEQSSKASGEESAKSAEVQAKLSAEQSAKSGGNEEQTNKASEQLNKSAGEQVSKGASSSSGSVVPEPATISLFGAALGAVALIELRRRRAAEAGKDD
ncbi:PEP-CTERM sorting domain-containing protein [Viridibacterium curvum]|uniref:PEP-CTERM sorting domain-containing protein n=1 Tax=Viridibacterium curvum TaxID=1101404 RepID=A0ABP9QPD7_9RHOO